MAIMTQAELAIRQNADLRNATVVYEAVKQDPILAALPAISYTGPGLENVRKVTTGDVQGIVVGASITARASFTSERALVRARTAVGDIDQNGLVEAEGRGSLAQNVEDKAQQLGEYWSTQIHTGSGADPDFNSFSTLVDPSQYMPASPGQDLTPELLDQLLEFIPRGTDFLLGPRVLRRHLRQWERSLGGVLDSYQRERPDGTTEVMYVYDGVPVYTSDFASVEETANGAALTGGTFYSVYAGKFDSGEYRDGVAFVYPAGSTFGVQVESVGTREEKDETVTRVKSYANLGLGNRQNLARLPSLNLTITVP